MTTPPPDPVDPFAGDPDDPAQELAAFDAGIPAPAPLPVDEHAGVLGDLEDLMLFQTLLAPRGVRGLAVLCADCDAVHYFAWDLLRGNMVHLLGGGEIRVHEPAYDPDPTDYVSWDYARGYADGTFESSRSRVAEEPG